MAQPSNYDIFANAIKAGRFAPTTTPQARSRVRNWELVDAIEPITRAMLELARAQSDADHVLHTHPLATIIEAAPYNPMAIGFTAGKQMVFFNPTATKCADCKPPERADIMAREGLLGLKGVVVTLDTIQHLSAVTLILPPVNFESCEYREHGFTAVTVTVQGNLQTQVFMPERPEPHLLMRVLTQLEPVDYGVQPCEPNLALRPQLNEAFPLLQEYLLQVEWQRVTHFTKHAN